MFEGLAGLVAGASSLAAVSLVPELLARGRTFPEQRRQSVGLADFLPYRRFAHPDVIRCESSLLAAWRVAAPPTDVLAPATILNTSYHVAATLGLLGTGAVGQFYFIRSPFREYDRGLSRSDHPVLELLDDLREDYFLRRAPVFDSERFFALSWAPPNQVVESLRAATSAGLAARRRAEEDLLVEFEALCGRIEASLRVGLPVVERLGETIVDGRRRSDLLRFVARTVSGRDHPMAVPPPTVPLNELLARDFRFGWDVRIGEDELGIVELLTPPDSAAPQLLERLTQLTVPHTLAVRVAGMSLSESLRVLEDGVADFRGAADFHASLTNPAELRAAEQMSEAFGQAGDEYQRVGWTSTAVVLRAKTRTDVSKAAQAVVDALAACGFSATIAKAEAADTWLATLPGQRRYGMRTHPIDALTTAKALLPLHEEAKGPRFSDSESFPAGLDVPCVSYGLTRGNSPRRLHLNVADVFHGIMCGRTRSGKSVRTSYLASMFRGRLPLASVTLIDRGLSARPTCLMLDGTCYDVLGANSPGFALFADAHREDDGARELLTILEEMCELQGLAVTPPRRVALLEAIRTVASWPQRERRLFAFAEILGGGDDGHVLKPAIAAYGPEGVLGSLFDRAEDSFETGRFNVIDIAHVSSLGAKFLIPVLRVIFWRLAAQERRLKRDLGEDLHSLYLVDEAHAVLRHPIGAAWVLEQQKEGRKHNRGLWLVSNSVEDFATVPRLDDLLKASQLRMYAHDPGALDPATSALYAQLGLPRHGIEMLPTIGERAIVLHAPEVDTLCEVDLRLDEDVLAVLGSSRTNTLVDRFRELYPVERDGPQRWKIEMLRASSSPQVRAAATRFETILREKEI